MNVAREKKKQHAWSALLWVAVISITVGYGAHRIAAYYGQPITIVTGDSRALTRAPIHYGLVSNLGALLWCAAAAGCLLTAMVLRRSARPSRFFTMAGLLTLMLLVDDFWMLHETLEQTCGVPEIVTMGCYALAAFAFALRFRMQLLAGDLALLGVVALGLGGSLLLDVSPINEAIKVHEDTLKFAGICAWAAYWMLLSRDVLAAPPIALSRLAGSRHGMTPPRRHNRHKRTWPVEVFEDCDRTEQPAWSD